MKGGQITHYEHRQSCKQAESYLYNPYRQYIQVKGLASLSSYLGDLFQRFTHVFCSKPSSVDFVVFWRVQIWIRVHNTESSRLLLTVIYELILGLILIVVVKQSDQSLPASNASQNATAQIVLQNIYRYIFWCWSVQSRGIRRMEGRVFRLHDSVRNCNCTATSQLPLSSACIVSDSHSQRM